MWIQEIHIFELQIVINFQLMIFTVVSTTEVVLREWPEQNSNPDLCNADAVLYQLNYQVKCIMVAMWVDDKPVDDGYTSKFICIYK